MNNLISAIAVAVDRAHDEFNRASADYHRSGVIGQDARADAYQRALRASHSIAVLEGLLREMTARVG